jgi:glycosyltransferase involved in cell wall biosynthesis
MKIAVNARFLLKGKLEGIGWFTHEVLKRVVQNHPEHEFIFIFDRPFHPDFIYGKNVTPIVIPPPARHPILWYIWFEWSIKWVIKKHRPDLFISTDGFLSLSTKVPQLLVIHDLAFEHFPEHLPFKFRYYLRKFTPKFAQKAKHIVSVSTFSKNDLIETYGVPEEKISIVYNGANDLYKPLSFQERQEIKDKYAQGSEYFVFAGALHPRKNVLALLEAFTFFKKKQRSNMKLLIIGRIAWNAEQIQLKLQHHPFKEDVLHYDYMQVEELSKVIGAAYALTFVSIFEGFGIPILEAIKCHVPSICSNTSSMPEVAGNTAILVNPSNIEEIGNAMRTLYKDEQYRSQLKDNCKLQGEKFSWDKSAVDFYEVIKRFES